MKVVLNIADTECGLHDNFQDFFKRLKVETERHIITNTNIVCGPDELTTIETLLEAFQESYINPKRRHRMRELKRYYFDRDSFTKIFKEVFGDHIVDVEIACQEGKSTYSFLLHYDEDEFYIIHLESGTIINWYKHIGRTNTCNDDTFTLSDLRDFLILLRDELYGERGF